MSYDLTFLPKDDDQSWEEAMEAAETAAGDDDAVPIAEVWARLLAAGRDVLGEVSVYEGDGSYELDHEATGIELSYYAGEAAITVPYWYRGDDARRVVELIYRLGAAVESESGLSGFDPQVELGIADAAARPELAVATFDQVAASFAARGIDSPTNG